MAFDKLFEMNLRHSILSAAEIEGISLPSPLPFRSEETLSDGTILITVDDTKAICYKKNGDDTATVSFHGFVTAN